MPRCLLLRPILIFRMREPERSPTAGGASGAIDYDLKTVSTLASHGLNQPVLRADVAGMPLEWIDYKEAARLYHQGQVAYACGSPLYRLHGGTNALLRPAHRARGQFDHRHHRPHRQSRQHAPRLHPAAEQPDAVPPRRLHLPVLRAALPVAGALARPHPPVQPGRPATRWNNVVTACRRCNNAKASRTPEQAKMQLIAVPFTPTYAEYIFLKGRRVLADQMQYLLAHFPRSSPLHERIRGWLN